MATEEPNSTSVAPSFITTVLAQLNCFKVNVSDLQDATTLLNSTANICSYAQKIQFFLNNLKNTIGDIDVAFNDGYNAFLTKCDISNVQSVATTNHESDQNESKSTLNDASIITHISNDYCSSTTKIPRAVLLVDVHTNKTKTNNGSKSFEGNDKRIKKTSRSNHENSKTLEIKTNIPKENGLNCSEESDHLSDKTDNEQSKIDKQKRKNRKFLDIENSASQKYKKHCPPDDANHSNESPAESEIDKCCDTKDKEKEKPNIINNADLSENNSESSDEDLLKSKEPNENTHLVHNSEGSDDKCVLDEATEKHTSRSLDENTKTSERNTKVTEDNCSGSSESNKSSNELEINIETSKATTVDKEKHTSRLLDENTKTSEINTKVPEDKAEHCSGSSEADKSSTELEINIEPSKATDKKSNKSKEKTKVLEETDSDISKEQSKNKKRKEIDKKLESENADESLLIKSELKTEPKFGLIKCIDISKLLDPKAIPAPPKIVESIILLSSSDESCGPPKRTEKRKQVSTSSESSSDQIGRRKLPVRNVFSRKSKSAFENLKKLRKLKNKKIINTSSSDSDSSSVAVEQAKWNTKKTQKEHELVKSRMKDSPNTYDSKTDEKLKSECVVSLAKVPLDKLKEQYLAGKEDDEVYRLTKMSSLKRNRDDSNNTSPTLDNKLKKQKKLSKHQKKALINSDADDGSKNSYDETDNMPPMPNGDEFSVESTDPPIPDKLLASSDNEETKASDNDDDKDVYKKTKNKDKPKQKGKEKTDSSKKKDDELNSSADDEDDKKKSKWKNDKLLKSKLDGENSSDDSADKFRKKKQALNNDIESGSEAETIVSKKRITKKKLKRIARRLGSDLSSSDEEGSDKKQASSDEENYKEKRISSDSSSENSEDKTSKKKASRRRIKRLKDSEDDSDETKENKQKKKDEEDATTRKKIRGVWNKDSLAETTKRAAKEEEDRKKRIADRQKLYNNIYDDTTSTDENAKVGKVVLDFNDETKEELLSVHPDLVSKLKPHQAKGVQFMWTSCFESLEMSKKNEGSGCILAHCMGLGKTLQVITLIHTLLSDSELTNIKTVLVVCPLSTVLNWVAEFKKWLDDVDGEQVNVFDLVAYKQNYERLYQLQDWMKFGGVMVMGYDMFRNLSNSKGKRMSKKLTNGFKNCLLEPGPDMVVCDEGHLLKNEKTGISIAMNRLKTKRRIVLTGTPLQNNLKEYFCMVQFVKPNLLGTYKEYLNRFVNPITNGQYTDSTDHDISIMRRRAHVLHKMLDGIVERRDYNVLAPFLPPKHEYVLFILLTKVQSDLYAEYLTKFARNTSVKGTSYLFQDFQELQRICIHPRVLLDKSNKDKLRNDMNDDSEGSLKDFIDDDEKSTSESAATNSASDSDNATKQTVSTRRTRANPNAIEEEEAVALNEDPEEWWQKHCEGDALDNIRHSSKLLLLFEVLHQCELIGDKVLIFSQSLYSLNLIEYFLSKIDEATQKGTSCDLYGGVCGSWAIGLDYFRLDGSTSCENRAASCKTFNNPSNTRARLFLISTRAGGLGINLVAANRVIIFDVSWNPSYDVQSIYRVYRFGQTKPCYVYRFVTMGTMENKIYERQVTKQAISKRVIDEQQIDRHYNQTDLAELYAFNPVPEEERPTPLVPKDRLFADLLQTHEKNIFKYHEHNSLLENKTDEGLNEEERQAAWEEFENEKKAPKFNLMQTMVRNGMYETLRVIVQQDNSTWTPAQVNNFLPTIVQRISEQVSRGDYSMYRRVEEKHEMRVMEQRRLQFVYQQYMQQIRQAGNTMTPAEMAKLAQMIGSLNTTMANPQPAASSSAVSFAEGAYSEPAAAAPPTIVGDVIELHD